MVNAIVVLIIGLGGGLFFIALGIVWIIRGIKSKSWFTTKGTISFSELVEMESGPEDIGGFSAMVFYEYKVANRSYTSDKVDLSHGSGVFFTKRPADSLVSKHTEGTQVRVYYNPAKPAQAILRPGLTRKYLLEIFVFLIMGIISIVGSSFVFYGFWLDTFR